MYNSFFKLTLSPFGNTPDPQFVFETPSCSAALDRLTAAILGRRGIAVLTGDAGTGKTTVLSRLLFSLPSCSIQSSVVLNPSLSGSELLEAILIDFGIDPVPASKVQRLLLLQKLLIEGDRKGKISALFVDEAHGLTPELLEELRLLTNIEIENRKLLQIVLTGQSELDALLNRWDLRQFKQRITLRLQLDYLTPDEVAAYIHYRWARAGGKEGAPFTAEAIRTIAAASGGVARIVNNVCDNALLIVFSEARRTVTVEDVRDVLMEFGMAMPEENAPVSPPFRVREGLAPVGVGGPRALRS